MKKLTLLVAALSFAFAAPVFACPSMDGAAPKTAKKDTASKEKTATAKKDTAKKPTTTAKKADDKVSMK